MITCKIQSWIEYLFIFPLTFRKPKQIYFVSLSSLPTAVRFYKRMNFKEFKEVKFTGVTIEEGESFVPGQVYMELRVRNETKASKKKGRK